MASRLTEIAKSTAMKEPLGDSKMNTNKSYASKYGQKFIGDPAIMSKTDKQSRTKKF